MRRAVLALLATAVCLAQDTNGFFTTRHQIKAGGEVLRYTAHAGLLPVRNNDVGEVHANVFFVAYFLDRAPGAPARPLTFLWNGGPGANSTLVHLAGFGPRRIRTGDDAAVPSSVEPVMEDNAATWLKTTDLVFVDPVGTGFSRPAKPEYAAEFYRTLGDIASIAEFVRVFRIRFDAFESSLFLAGESYGTWRASGVAEALEKRREHVAGVILISGGIQMGPVSPDAVRVALYAPSRAAVAFYHNKLAPELMRDEATTMKEVEAWALSVYAPAWERRNSLTDSERDAIIAKLARYTGVGAQAIDRKTLMMTSPQFTAALIPGERLGRYDMRLKGQAAATVDSVARDRVIMNYLRRELRVSIDLPYQGIEEGYSSGAAKSVGARWVWDQVDTTGGPMASTAVGSGDGPPPAQPWLRRAMVLNPSLKAFMAAGLYDSLNSCADSRYLIAHIEPLEFSRNVTLGCYRGGHMMYDTREARYQLERDVAAFIKTASKSARER